ncbi:MAG: Peptidyl-prolyl cis-trans isomerase [candidate division WWE3 bacterium GW2011_GWF1_42_14]|uniref:Peptidyl-prolyl cis-trans isomerase n=2 Tax=Katanobacteria TaxID=422282 RepID=A0A0G1AVT5_UNCKA|nr:MAG: Peptidyl-prolyl cis-trans isomerase [candidate division WWE3 bacterium GW2011_GWA1_42_12]KKS34780.1 MAG: Peptidyl-prolyl cis-trans isomerase [candidate division WWE3 bacterium GW2011_GWD1_42_14]KKS38181.1 MAG: Peptidyl-prolyl cis-trans isomerase [candidate division WWE3 bacterium GW2011_GWF1_42_14]KKS40318.1 MAG: Peptidyl-prolyl cis-trans isomerase [candidate division WWE3 bacterium GW2011_GWE1_42_16]KKS67153.1 MAG: Peptidyl-prolyl cis-trans isomerase [candidate division WWE3 bacterium 
MKNKALYIAILLPVLILVGLAVFGSKLPKGPVKQEEKKTNLLQKLDTPESSESENDYYQINPTGNIQKEPFKMSLNLNKKYSAVMATTEGVIKIDLYADKTPVTVNNFVSLSKANFYNDVIFHRVVKGFMIQGGDPDGTGAGGPGYKFDDEPFDGEYTRGTIAMANAGPNTNGSQFFIMHQDYPMLPKDYVIFGKVSEGLEVVDKIAEAEITVNSSGEASKPVKPVKILGIQIIESD